MKKFFKVLFAIIFIFMGYNCGGGGGGGGGGTGDATPPSVPTALTLSVESSSMIKVSWSAATDNIGVTGYRIYGNGNCLRSVSDTSASIEGLYPNISYCYTVSAVDAAGNVLYLFEPWKE